MSTGAYAIDKGQLQGVMRAFEKTKNNDGRVIAAALRRCAEIVLRRARVYVPVDRGVLRESGAVDSNNKAGLAAQFAVVYAANYAVYVHERTDIPHAPPTSAKYLERAAREMLGTCQSLVRRKVRTEFN